MIDFEEDVPAPAADGLARVVELCNLLVKQEDEVAVQEEHLAAAKARLLQTQRNDLPELMREIGIMDITLEGGRKVVLKDDLSCRITDTERAHAWLIEHGFAGLIKTQVVVEFAKGTRDEALACVELIHGAIEQEVVAQEVVHSATLKSFIKEQLEAGADIPLALFNVVPFSYAKTEVKKRG